MSHNRGLPTRVILAAVAVIAGLWHPATLAQSPEYGTAREQGLALHQVGKLKEAVPFLEKALAIAEKDRSPEWPDGCFVPVEMRDYCIGAP